MEETSLCTTASKSHEMLVLHAGRGKLVIARADLDGRVANPHGLAPDMRLQARVHEGAQSRHLVGGRHPIAIIWLSYYRPEKIARPRYTS